MKQWDKIFKNRGKVFLKIDPEIKKAVKIFRKHKVKKVLDLGCGSGRHLVYLAKNGFKMYGIDIAKAGVNITRKWLKKNQLTAELKRGNIYKTLPYKNNFFDAVISTNAIHHAKIVDIRHTIKEIERILKPSGLIFINCRRRKFRKKWLKKGTMENNWDQPTKYKVIAPRTYMPLNGGEKGLPHYLFNKYLLKKEFHHFKIYNIWINDKRRHYFLLGELKYY